MSTPPQPSPGQGPPPQGPPQGAPQGGPQGGPQGAPQGAPQGGPQGIPMPMHPGQKPTPEQIQAMRRQLEADAEKAGMSVQQFVEQLKQKAQAQRMAAMQRAQAQGQGPPGQMRPMPPGGQQRPPGAQPVTPGPPNPKAIALANFLRGQQLKPRTCILNGERKDMFKVKRALRALQSPAYEKARKKNPILPEITDRASLENTFKLLPMSMLALRVVKSDPHAGHDHKKPKRVKGLWTVKIEPQQEAKEEMYYVWLYEGSQVMRKVYAALALMVIFLIVCYPLWPLKLRQGVYYLSWGFLGLLGLFFLMAIFRVILFCVTYFAVAPGLWLFPNLWEDVSFLDSFRPVWAWHETAKKGKKKKTTATASAGGGGGGGKAGSTFAAATGQPAPASATTTATETQVASQQPEHRAGYSAPRVEELDDDEE